MAIFDSRTVNAVRDRVPPPLRRLVGPLLRRAATVGARADDLQALGLRAGTDKASHGYLPHYQRHFAPLRLEPLTLLEIGIGGNEDPAAGGASLRMWRDYFPNARIHGADIADKSAHAEARIEIHRLDQNDPAALAALVERIGPPDIVIDDGSHVSEHVLTSFETLFPLMAERGLYVVEDLHTSYLPEFGGSSTDLERPESSVARFKRLADTVNWKSIAGGAPGAHGGTVAGLHFYPKMVVIERAPNDYPQAATERRRIASDTARLA